MGALAAFLWGVFFVIVLNLFHDSIVGLYTSEPEIVELVNKVYSVLSIYVLFDALGGMGNGLIIGIGR